MEGPPRDVEYICLLCGVQGLTKISAKTIDRLHDPEVEKTGGDDSLLCPKCGYPLLCIEREVASSASLGEVALKS